MFSDLTESRMSTTTLNNHILTAVAAKIEQRKQRKCIDFQVSFSFPELITRLHSQSAGGILTIDIVMEPSLTKPAPKMIHIISLSGNYLNKIIINVVMTSKYKSRLFDERHNILNPLEEVQIRSHFVAWGILLSHADQWRHSSFRLLVCRFYYLKCFLFKNLFGSGGDHMYGFPYGNCENSGILLILSFYFILFYFVK